MGKKKNSKKKNTSKKEIEVKNEEIEIENNEIEENFELEKEEKKELSTEFVDNESDAVATIDSNELNDLMEADLEKIPKEIIKHHYLTNTFLIIVLILSFVSFGLNILDKNVPISSIINSLLLSIFTLLFVVVSLTYKRKKKNMIFLSSILLLFYYLLGINNHFELVSSPIEMVPNFQGKNITSIMKWAEKHKITVHQEYEYSDMIAEYKIISQDIKADTALKDLDEITISVSEGPNPSKEIMLPSMITWDDERVLTFIKENYLTNVTVDFESSDQAKDTVIEQSQSGSFKRDEELHLTFSYGEELGYDEVSLIDFTNKSKFEVEFYMKQHQLRYDFEEEFSNKIKKGYATKQNIKAGKIIKINDERVVVTISKGPKIEVPELSEMSLLEVTEWAIKNKLKLNFEEAYDEKIKENNVIKANYSKGDIIEQGTVVKVTLSKGNLKMPKFKSLDDFHTWANKYNIDYEEKHEFSDKVPVGEVISYSHKTGDTIKNNDTIIVTISDGDKETVPNLNGMTKKEAITALEKVNLKYSFTYKNSDKKKDTVIGQSIKSGSEISSGVTITVTLSNGKGEEKVEERKSSDSTNKKENNSNNNNNSSSNNNDNKKEEEKEPTPTPTPTSEPEPTPSCKSCTITGIKGIISTNIDGGYQAVSSALISGIKSQCPGIKVNISADDTSKFSSGQFISGFNGGNTDSCSTVSITLAK